MLLEQIMLLVSLANLFLIGPPLVFQPFLISPYYYFIEQFPLQFNTEVGERGLKLSGGQRQRIAIARALLRQPSLLMLDEATSSLDSESEQLVQQALEKLMEGRTTLIIAHRLSTVIDADQLIFLEKGRITGVGTHHHLMESHALYRKFANRQFKLNDDLREKA